MSSQLNGSNYTKFGDYTGQSSAPPVHVLDFIRFISFRNLSALKATGRKVRFNHFQLWAPPAILDLTRSTL